MSFLNQLNAWLGTLPYGNSVSQCGVPAAQVVLTAGAVSQLALAAIRYNAPVWSVCGHTGQQRGTPHCAKLQSGDL